MKLQFIVDKKACFYYWVQSICLWNENATCMPAYKYFKEQSPIMNTRQSSALRIVFNILSSADRPQQILTELYTNSVNSDEAKRIYKECKALYAIFENNVWPSHQRILTDTKNLLDRYHFSIFDKPMRQINHFFNSDLNLETAYKVLLIQNMESWGSAGHAIYSNNLILLHPKYTGTDKIRKTVSTLVHEYIHLIEHKSEISKMLYKRSFDDVLRNKLDYNVITNWKAAYVETMVYCFANNSTHGLLSTLIYDKAFKTKTEQQNKWMSMINNNQVSFHNFISWVSLNLQEDVSKYLKHSQVIDEVLIDKMSRMFLKNAQYLQK